MVRFIAIYPKGSMLLSVESRKLAAPSTPDGAQLLASGVRRDIFEALASLPEHPTPAQPHARAQGLTAHELAERVDLHVTTVRFHLDQLVAAGLLTTSTERIPGAAGRPRKLYAAARASRTDGGGSEPYRLLAELLVTTVVAGGDAGLPDQAGLQWARRRAKAAGVRPEPPAASAGAWLSKIARVIDMLSDWGYTATVRTTNSGRTAQLLVERCPIHDLAQQAPGVLCGLHRGAMRGMLEALGEDGADVAVQPSVAPGLCVAQLTSRIEFATPQEKK